MESKNRMELLIFLMVKDGLSIIKKSFLEVYWNN